MAKEYGILCSSYGTYFRLGETDLAELEDYIFAAKLLGTDVLRLWCGNKNSQEYGSDEKNALFEQCREAAKTAEKNGVKLCMECHNNTYTNTADSALELMQSVNSSSFKMYWQPNQFCSEEENLQYAEKISPYCEHIHVFNWRGEERFPLSEGMAMWKKYVGKFDTDKTLLLEFMPDDRKESLPFEAAALRRLAGV